MIINDNNIYKLTDDSLRPKTYMCCFKRTNGLKFGPILEQKEKLIDKN